MTLLDRPWVRALYGSGLLVAPLVVLGVLASMFGSVSTKQFVLTLLINVIVVVGMQTFIGNSGIVSFGHVTFMGVGAYAVAIFTITASLKEGWLPLPGVIERAELGFMPGMLAAIAVTGLVGLAIGAVLVRLSGGAGSIATFALLIVFHSVAVNVPGVIGGTQTILGVPKETTITRVLMIAALAILAARFFRETRAGLRLRASSVDPLAAQAMGVSYVHLRLIAWTLSAMIVGAGGVLYAQNLTAFGPGAFYFGQAFLFLAMLIIGGMTTVSGAVAGAVVMSAAYQIVRGIEDGFQFGPISFGGQVGLTQLAVAVAIIATMAIRPSGLFGRVEVDEGLALVAGRRVRRAESTKRAPA